MSKWLVKSEPTVYSIDDFKRDRVTHWGDVRNYQARNFLKQMQQGDLVLFYHSSSDQVGIAGLAEVKKIAYPDPAQFNKNSEYFDAKASVAAPRWFCPDLRFVSKFDELIPLGLLKQTKELKTMPLLQRGSRLSVQPVSEQEFEIIISLSKNR